MKRYARIRLNPETTHTVDTVVRYLPDNYEVVAQDGNNVYIVGEDYAGWTMDDYVIPRLASGGIFVAKINEAEFVRATRGG